MGLGEEWRSLFVWFFHPPRKFGPVDREGFASEVALPISSTPGSLRICFVASTVLVRRGEHDFSACLSVGTSCFSFAVGHLGRSPMYHGCHFFYCKWMKSSAYRDALIPGFQGFKIPSLLETNGFEGQLAKVGFSATPLVCVVGFPFCSFWSQENMGCTSSRIAELPPHGYGGMPSWWSSQLMESKPGVKGNSTTVSQKAMKIHPVVLQM